MTGLYKTTIIIWSDFNPDDYDIEDLSREAMNGEAYCSLMNQEFIDDPSSDPDWDGTDFFKIVEEKEEDDQ